jgi:hypothetical protein
VHEILREEVVRADDVVTMQAILFTATTIGIMSIVVSGACAQGGQKLSGAQIRARFAGMQLTDEVHYRFVYDRDGTLRSYAMSVKKRGKWVVDRDQLCLYFNEPDDGCYEVSLSGKSFTLTPVGLGSTLDGFLQMPPDRE